MRVLGAIFTLAGAESVREVRIESPSSLTITMGSFPIFVVKKSPTVFTESIDPTQIQSFTKDLIQFSVIPLVEDGRFSR